MTSSRSIFGLFVDRPVLTAMVTRGVMKRQDTRRRRWLARVGA